MTMDEKKWFQVFSLGQRSLKVLDVALGKKIGRFQLMVENMVHGDVQQADIIRILC